MVLIDHAFTEVTTAQLHSGDTNWTSIPGATISSGNFVAGDKYLIFVTAQLGGEDVDQNFGIRTRHGTTVFTESEHNMEPSTTGATDFNSNYCWFTVWTAVSAEDINMQFQTSTPPRNVQVDQITMVAIRLEDLVENIDYFFDFNSTSTALNTAFSTSNNASVSITPSIDSDWLVMSYAVIAPNSTDQFESRMEVTGGISSTEPLESIEGEDPTNDLMNFFLQRVYSLSAGASHTFTQQSRNIDGPDGTRLFSGMFALNLRRFVSHSFSYTAGGIAGGAGPIEVSTTTIAPNSVNDTFVGGFFTLNPSGSTSDTGARLQVDNADQPPTQTSDNYALLRVWDSQDLRSFHINSIENLGASSHNIDLDIFNSGASDSYTNRLTWGVELQTSADEFVDVDGLLQATFDETFTVDAILQATFDETFTVNALVKAFGDNGDCGASVQSGTATISNSSSSTNVTIDSVPLDNAFLIFQYNVDAGDTSDMLVTGALTSSTNILFERVGSNNQVNISWYVVEPLSSINSQRGSDNMNSPTVNIGISSVDISNSFVLGSVKNSDTDYGDNDAVRLRLTSSTNLEASSTASMSETNGLKWQVIEHSKTRVQRGTLTFSTAKTSQNVTIDFVDTSRSIVLLTHKQDLFTVVSGEHGLTGELTSPTNLLIKRESGSSAVLDIAWEVIEFPSNVKVQTGTEAFGITEQQRNVTLGTAVNLNRTAVVLSHDQKGGRTTETTDDNPNTVWYKAELTSNTNLQLTRGNNANGSGSVVWFVVEFDGRQQKCFFVDTNVSRREQFIIDGIIIRSAQASVDALLQGVPSEMFALDSLLQTTFGKTFSTDGRLVREAKADIDARLRRVQTEEFDTDSLLLRMQDETFDADGLLQKTNAEEFEVDSRVRDRVDLVFKVDGALSESATEAFTVDSILVKTFTKDFTVDLRLAKRKAVKVDTILITASQFKIDSILGGTIDKNFTVDGLPFVPPAVLVNVDSRLVTRNTEDFIIDSIVRERQEEEFKLNALLLQEQEEQFIIDARLEQVKTKTFAIDAFVLLTATENFTVDGLSLGVITKTFTIDAFSSEVNEETFIVNGLLSLARTKDFTADGFLSKEKDITFTSDSVLKATQNKTFKADGITFVVPSAVIMVDALFIVRRTKEFSLDSILIKRITKTTKADARVRLRAEKQFSVDLLVLKSKPFIVDSLLSQSKTKTFTLDSILTPPGANIEAFLVDSLLKVVQTKGFTTDARIASEKEFTLDALIQRSGDNCNLGLIFTDTIDTSSGWSITNCFSQLITVDGTNNPDQIDYFRLGACLIGRLNKALDQGQGGIVTISSKSDIRLDFKYRHTNLETGGGSSVGPIVMGVCKDNAQIDLRERFAVRTLRSGSQLRFVGEMSDTGSTGTGTQTATIDIPIDTDVFVTLEKVGQNMILNVYSDEERTTHIAGSPTPFADVSSLDEVIYDHVGGSSRRTTDFGGSNFFISGLLDDINVQTRICIDYSTDAFLKATIDNNFTADAKIVRVKKFTVSAFLKALGDNRCDFENLFEDPFTTTFGWSNEINNTTADGWGTQRIFIDDESGSSSFIDEFGSLQGLANVTMQPGGFSPSQTPILKTKYRRKRLDSIGGLGRVKGNKIRVDLEFTLKASGGLGGTWVGLNKSGFHFDNDTNSPGLQVLSSSASRLAVRLTDGVNVAQTGDSDFTGLGIKKFIVINIDGNDMTLNIYNDAEHTVHFGNSPIGPVDISSINKDILDLQWLILGANPRTLGPANPSGTADIDQVKVFASACPQALVDGLVEFIPQALATVDALIVREIKFNVDAKLRGRKDFTIDASVVKLQQFTIDATFLQRNEVEFTVDPITLGTIELDITIDSSIVRAKQVLIDAITQTEPSDPNFSLTHLQDITPLFGGIEEKAFLVDVRLSRQAVFTADAVLKEVANFSIDGFLTTVPQPIFFSISHLQDIVPLFSVAVVDEQFEIDSNILQRFEETLLTDAQLRFKNSQTPLVDAVLIQIEKTFGFTIDSLLKKLGQAKSWFINSRLVNRNTEEFIVDGFQFAEISELLDIDSLVKALNQVEQIDIDVRVTIKRTETFTADALLKFPGENGFCNFFPGTNTFGTGLEQFVGPITPSHERNVDLLIGQEFNLDNQQVRSATILLRASDFPNEITGDSLIDARIWSNVSVGQQSGEVVEATSNEILNANFTSGDLPPGVWIEQKFTFDPDFTPFLTGDHVIGIFHNVGAGVDDPEGVGVAIPVISNNNVIPGSVIFRRGTNSGFSNPDTWDFLISISKDMVIDLELVNGNEIVEGRGKRCPVVDSIITGPPRENVFVDAIVDDFKQLFFTADALIKRLGKNSECTPAPEQGETKGEVEFYNTLDKTISSGGMVGESIRGQRINMDNFKVTRLRLPLGMLSNEGPADGTIKGVIVSGTEFFQFPFTIEEESTETFRIDIESDNTAGIFNDIPLSAWQPISGTQPPELFIFNFDPDFTPFLTGDIVVGILLDSNLWEDSKNIPNQLGAFSMGESESVFPGEATKRLIELLFDSGGGIIPTDDPWLPLGNDAVMEIWGIQGSLGIQPFPTSTNGENAGASCLAIDACLTGQPKENFTADAILDVVPKEFTIDGITLVTPGFVFSVDAILDGPGRERLFLVDARVKITKNAPLFNVNALLVEEKTETLLVDGTTKFINLVAPFRADALLGVPETRFFLLDAVLRDERIRIFLVDGLRQRQDLTKIFVIDAFRLKKLGIKRHVLVSAILKTQPEKTFSVDAKLGLVAPPKSFTVDAQILLANARWKSDALLMQRQIFSVNMDAIATESQFEDFTINVIVKAFDTEKEALIDGLVTQGSQKLFLVDGQLETENTFGFLVDTALFKAGQTETTTISAKLIQAKQFVVDALFEEEKTTTFIVDTLIGVRTEQFTADAILKGFDLEETTTIDAKVAFKRTKALTADAILNKTKNFIISAFVGEVEETTLDVESVIVDNSAGDSGFESTIGVGEAD